MPFAGYKNFADCVAKNSSKKDPKAYCSVIMRAVEDAEKEGEVSREHRINDLFDLNEAVFSVEETTGRMLAEVTILRAGKSKNPRIYQEGAVKKAGESGIFNGLRMFVNHSDKPPMTRSLTEMVSAVESTSYNSEKKAVVGKVVFFNKDFFEFARNAKDYMGDSINALARGNRIRQPNGEVIEDISEIVKGHSVDWVIYPAAGGEIQQFLESEGDDEVEWDKITLEDLKTHAPTLWDDIKKAIHEEDKSEGGEGDPPKNGKKSEVTPEVLQEMITKAIKDHDEEMEKTAKDKAEATKKLEDVLGKSGLPDKTRRRISAQFGNTSTFVESVVTEAIKEAKEELAAGGAGPHIKGMGVSGEGSSVTDHPSGIPVYESVEALFGVKKKTEEK